MSSVYNASPEKGMPRRPEGPSSSSREGWAAFPPFAPHSSQSRCSPQWPGDLGRWGTASMTFARSSILKGLANLHMCMPRACKTSRQRCNLRQILHAEIACCTQQLRTCAAHAQLLYL